MAFTNTRGRYASFGVVTSLPDDIIDSFWYIIDNFLKGVFELDELLRFELINRQGKLTFRFSETSLSTTQGVSSAASDVYKRQEYRIDIHLKMYENK